MSEQENVRLIKEQYAAFQRGDIKTVLEAMADDIEWITPGPPALLPLAGHRRGRDEVTQFFSLLGDTNEYSRFEPVEFIAQGDRVVVLIEAQGTVKQTGRPIEAEIIHVFTVRGGKVERFREFFDTAAVLDAYQPAAADTSRGA